MEASWSNCKLHFGILMFHFGINPKDQQNRASEMAENLVSKTASDIASLELKTIIETITKKLKFKA